MNDELKLRNRLKEARFEKKLSQSQLAEMVGVSRNTISSIETGQFNPTAKLALILCIALDKKFEELFYFYGGHDGSFIASDIGHIPVNPWHRKYKRKYQHNPFLQPSESKRGRCSQIRQGRWHGNACHWCFPRAILSRHILECRCHRLYRSSGAGDWLIFHSIWTNQVQPRYLLTVHPFIRSCPYKGVLHSRTES